MAPDKKILILGASGTVGRVLLKSLGPKLALGTYRSRFLEGGVQFDALTMDVEEILPDPSAFSHAVIFLGETNLDKCHGDERAYRLNVPSIQKIIAGLRRLKVTPVFASTESIFDGERGGYTELDEPRPILDYGRQKVEVERFLLNGPSDFLITRFSKIYGGPHGDGSMFTACFEAALRGETIYGAPDQIHSAVYVDDVIAALTALMRRKATGIYHIASPVAASRLQMLETFLEQLAPYLPRKAKLVSKSITEFGLKEPRPVNVSLNPAKLRVELGSVPRSAAEMSGHIAEELVRTMRPAAKGTA